MQLTKTDVQKARLITAITNSFNMSSDACGQAAVYGLILYLIESNYDIEWLCKALSFFAMTFESLLMVADYEDIVKALEYEDKKGFVYFEDYYYSRQATFVE